MEFRTFTFATIFLVIGTILISNSECSPAPILPANVQNIVESTLSSVKDVIPQPKKLFRQGRYYMGYPYGGLGMGYGGYPMMYGK